MHHNKNVFQFISMASGALAVEGEAALPVAQRVRMAQNAPKGAPYGCIFNGVCLCQTACRVGQSSARGRCAYAAFGGRAD
jgi:hypothetical protein